MLTVSLGHWAAFRLIKKYIRQPTSASSTQTRRIMRGIGSLPEHWSQARSRCARLVVRTPAYLPSPSSDGTGLFIHPRYVLSSHNSNKKLIIFGSFIQPPQSTLKGCSAKAGSYFRTYGIGSPFNQHGHCCVLEFGVWWATWRTWMWRQPLCCLKWALTKRLSYH